MSLTKAVKKILSVTVICAFMMQQTGFVFAATNVDTWAELKTGVENFPASYNVTETLNANSTIAVTANGNTITGYSLNQATANPLFNVNSGVSSFVVSNTLVGSIVNNGIMTYNGSSLSNGTVTGTGTFVFSSDATSANNITQALVQTTTAADITNNAAITAGLVNAGTIAGTGSIQLTDNSSSTGNIEQNGFNTNGFNFVNTANLTTNASFANTATLSGTNGSLTVAGGTANNSGTITQNAVHNAAIFANTGFINTNSLYNTGDFAGDGILNLTGDSANYGTIAQDLVTLTNNMTFTNNGMLLAKASNAAGSTLDSDPDNLGEDVLNAGTLNLNGTGSLTVNVSGTGNTNISGDLTNQGSISQDNINVAAGYVVTSSASDMTATTAINNDGVIHYTGGTTDNTIAGSGRVDITGYVTNTGDITQNVLGNSGIFTNDGTVTANLENTKTIEGTGSIATGTGLSYNTGTIAQDTLVNNGTFDNSGHITLTDSLVNAQVFNTNADLLVAANGVTNTGDLNITGGTNANVITGTGSTHFTGDAINNKAITQTTVTNSANLTNNALITANITNSGTLTSAGANIVGDIANTGSYVITNGNNANKITGTGTTTVFGTTANNGTITQEQVIIGNLGDFTTNSDKVTADIENQGKMTWNSGTTNKNVVTGNGHLTVTDTADVLNTAAISQDTITVNGTAALTTDAGLLAASNGITNHGDLGFLSGTNTNEIFGAGNLSVLGNVTNEAAIEQDTISVDLGELTSNANLLVATNGITNDAKLTLTGGTNINTVTGSGTTYIDGTVTNTGTIDTNIGVGVSGHYATTSDISKALDNSGTTDLTNADVNAAITGTGTTNILGSTTNNSTITQDQLNIASNGSFGTDIDNVSAVINNEGAFTITGGSANANVISGNGTLKIAGGNITNSASINQGGISITGGKLTSNADLLASAAGITNNVASGLTLTGGTNANAINGTGSTVINGNVVNAATINQDSLSVNGGKLTTAADAITTANGISNNAEVLLTGGDNNNNISGTGLTYIDGTVTNAANITTNIQINADANLGTLTDIVSTVENRGLLQLVDANITSTGKVKGTGVVNVLGDTTNSGKITGETVNITAGGHLTTDSDKVEASIVNDSDLTWNAGTGNANAISGTGNLEITGTGVIANTATISQGKITISNGGLSSNADLLASAKGIANNSDLTFTGGTNANNITGTGDLYTSGTVINKANITQNGLANTGDFTNDKGLIVADVMNSGNFINDDGIITGDVANSGVFTTNGAGVVGDITNNGTYVIVDGDNGNDITGTGDLHIDGTTVNSSIISQDTIFVATDGTFVATDISDVSTTTGIDNAGVLELQSGTNANAISGNTGALKVTGAVSNNAGVAISQDNIDIFTLGSFTANAGDLVTVNGITNTGKLTLGDGSTANNISGTGSLTTTGTINNTGNINQKSLANTGTLTSDASLLAFASGINNTNTLNLTGGTNANAISGTGATHFTNDVINNGEITQATVTNAAGILTNNAAITADFTNNTGTVNNEAVITGAITNTNGTVNSTADNLNGVILNNAVLNVAGGTVQNTISGVGNMNITADLLNAQNITQDTVFNEGNMVNDGAITVYTSFTNNGALDNGAVITGAIINNGTIDSVATHLVGAVANDGLLNLEGGITKNTISGIGETNITGDLINDYTINQNSVSNTASLTNNATITAADITNSGTIIGKASDLVASNEIANSGSLVFDAASTGASKITGTGDVQVTANTTLTGANTYTGGTLIDGADLTVASQKNIGTGDVKFANDAYLVVTGAGALNNNLAGNAAIEDVNIENAAALTLNGTISGADFTKDGAGVMTLAMASNDYTGDTYVDAGTLIGNTGNINNAVIGAAGTTVDFNDTVDAELNEINTLGTFVKSGSALLNVKNEAFTAAQVELNSGILAANRDITADALNVNNGATLRGNGNITGNVAVNSGATLAPGNSIDTLTITGNLDLVNGSTTAIEINETPASDKIVVTGNTTIESGAKLTVSNENGRYFEWKSFDIMEAGNVSGEFTYDGTIADYDASRIDVDVDYSDSTKVVLTAKRKATDYEGGATAASKGLSRNQSEVAHAIDAVSTGFDGDITNALLQLEELGGLNPQDVTLINPNSTLKSALNDIGGVLYANSALTSLFNAKTAHVYDRIAKRNPSTGSCPTCHDNVWVEYYNQYDKVYANSNSPRFTNTMSGVLVGYDRSSDNLLLGAYAGFGKDDLRQSSDRMDIEDATLGIYSGYMTGDWIFKGTLYGGHQNYNGKRYISFMDRTATGKYEGWSLALDLEGGYNVPVFSWLNVKPFVGALASYSHQQSFTEKGADSLNLHVRNNNQVNTQARLGVQLDGKIKSKLSWYGSVAVKQMIGDDYAKLHMYLDLPGTRMNIYSAELGKTFFSGQVGLNYAITDSLSIFGNLDTSVNDKSAGCYGNLGLAYTW